MKLITGIINKIYLQIHVCVQYLHYCWLCHSYYSYNSEVDKIVLVNSTNKFLDLQKGRKSSENTIRPSCNCLEWQCNIAQWQIIIMYITYHGQVFGETPNIFMFWLFPENGSISERTVKHGINSSYNSIKFCIIKKKYSFSFSPCTKTIHWL